jgi:hypothetical protein
MRHRRELQFIYKTKERLILSVRHLSYWERRNHWNPTDIQKQYVSKGKKDRKLRYPSRTFKLQVENYGNWLVQKAQWEIRLQRV